MPEANFNIVYLNILYQKGMRGINGSATFFLKPQQHDEARMFIPVNVQLLFRFADLCLMFLTAKTHSV